MNNNKQFRYYTEFKIIKDSIKKLNPEFALCTILVAYHGDNQNGSSISKEVFEECLWSLYGVPIVGEWIKKEEDQNKETWGSHGGRLIWDSEGIKYEQTTKPFGFVTEEAYKNVKWVEILEKDGHTTKEYIKLEKCILWVGRYNECESILDKNYGQSMEIGIEDAEYREDGYMNIKKFIFSALCILGDEHPPCFESASIGRQYELNQFKEDVKEMMNAYKKFNSEDTSFKEGNSVFNISNTLQDNQKKKEENKLVFSKDIVNAVKDTVHSYAKFRKEASDEQYIKYEVINVTETEVSFLDREDNYRAYTTTYTTTEIEGEPLVVVVDYNNKVEGSLVVGDKFEEMFSMKKEVEVHINDFVKFALAKRESEDLAKAYSELDAAKASYEAEKAESTKCKTQIASLLKEKSEYEARAKKEAVDSLISTYASIMTRCGDFDEYRARIDYSKDTTLIEKDLKEIYADYTLAKQRKNTTFAFDGVESGRVANANNSSAIDPIRARYGDAFDNIKIN